MEILAIFLSVITLFAVGFILIKLNSPKVEQPQNEKSLDLLHKQLEEMRGSITKLYSDNQNILQKVNTDLTQTLQNVDKNVNTRLDNAAKVINDVNRKLGEVHETTKQVQELSKDISSLQEILRAPKIRGGMGELFLSDLLSQVLPPSRYQLQYKFKSREAVDAVIMLKDLLIPIDSKFPLENFKKIVESQNDADKLSAKKQFVRDVKKHVDAIHGKYILPDEGTSDFALMYIPAENVYYEIIVKDENLDDEKSLFKYAMENKIFPVSPNSFYGYLQTILFGLRGMQIEERAQEILQNISQLEGDFARITDDFVKMGTHLKNLSVSYESTEKRIGKFETKLSSLEDKQEPRAVPTGRQGLLAD
ncbi:DNA recombination protein RmuC [Candidatus Saganbacteria bacterium]|nr:DNA recombination protein RmuC [Candidatus Saganbacteria bacterium]